MNDIYKYGCRNSPAKYLEADIIYTCLAFPLSLEPPPSYLAKHSNQIIVKIEAVICKTTIIH